MKFTRHAAVVSAIVAGVWFPTASAGDLPISELGEAVAKLQGMSNPEEVFAAMRTNFQAKKAKGVYARYLFNISGSKGGRWFIVVNDGAFVIAPGSIAKPDVILLTSDEDWVQLAKGTLGGIRAAMTGRLKVTGDPRIAHQLDEIFPWPRR